MDQQGNVKDSAKRLVSRRTLTVGAAWTAPVVLFAVASPAASASPLPPERVATLATVTADKGEAVDENRKVTLILTFAGIVGTNHVVILSIDGFGPWTGLPTPPVTVDSQASSATFLLTRPDTNNSTVTVTVHYTVNGVANSVPLTIKNKA